MNVLIVAQAKGLHPPVPVATQGPQDATKTIIGRPESAKRLAQRESLREVSSKPDNTVVKWGLRKPSSSAGGRADGTLDAFVWRSRRCNH